MNYRLIIRKKGLSDVYCYDDGFPKHAGVVCSLTTLSPSKKEWVFIPVRWFARRFPVATSNFLLIGVSRRHAIYRYMAAAEEVSQQ